ncbi:Deoxynucleoside triphosphate triphosphohydrolase SAMHD1 [Holothuria leucospilota]|uniref:Deoxynucleoside triphosphate triphosphohydrolase SAMHD1 n=1 Tax=Holothuria leucospilota TaxID=206669 RepID=A0A9Q1CAY8_HOLLE|nr:Deoxynucleoside triphosphate triphosphohydrolase SAMHD1 [Holothuria leucospilota]
MDKERKRKRASDDANEQDGSASEKKQLHLETDDTKSGDTTPKEGKVFNDSVHGHIEMHPLLVSIIDTPEFQRLRFIRQLGMCYFVYPGAAHNRFEHSLGVSYLAGELARSLQGKQKHLKITQEDILCVEVAGLCHDLGHGPFSHLFDESFLPRVRPDYNEKHEKLSVDMFEHMLKKNNLREKFMDHGLTDIDITFIKEQIVGVGAKQVKAVRNDVPEEGSGELAISKDELLTIIKQSERPDFLHVRNDEGETGLVSISLIEEVWPYKGRDKEKSFLYEIVANKRNGIDVDKWDYFARDSLYLGISNPFDWRRYLKFARVLDATDGMQICTRDKEITNLYDMFHTRYTLHRRAYQHRVNKILEAMIVDALIAANDHLLFAGKDGKMTKMSEAIDDMEAYSKLTDHVMWMILTSTDKKLDKARQLIDRIMKRDLYICVGQTQLKKNVQSNETPSKLVSQLIDIKKEDSEREIYDLLNREAKEKIAPDDIVVHIASYSYGMGEKDPVEHVKFYPKSDPSVTVEIRKLIDRDSMALPRQFSERCLRVCMKQSNIQCVSWVKEAFIEWCDDKNLRAKPGEFSADMTLTNKPRRSDEMKWEAGRASRQLDYDSTPLSRNSQTDSYQ